MLKAIITEMCREIYAKKFFLILFIIMTTFNYTLPGKTNIQKKSLCIYYSDKAGIEELRNFTLIVLDSKYYPKLTLEALIDNGKTVLGYISLGEIEQHRDYFSKFKKQGILLQENKDWSGSYFVDLRSPEWTEYVVNTLVPKILHKGFSGIFMDTLDNAEYLKNTNPKKYKGMKNAAVHLIKTIRKNYPNMKIMMNRAYQILPEVIFDINYELGECVYSDYNFETKKYNKTSKDDYKYQVEILQKAKKKNPELEIYTLDYWYPEDKKTIKEIYDIEIKNGFIPYVSTIDLDNVYNY